MAARRVAAGSPRRRLPHAGERAGPPRQATRRCGARATPRSRHQRGADRDAAQPAPPLARRIARQRRDQRLHRVPAERGVDAEAAQENPPQPGRDGALGRRRLDASRGHRRHQLAQLLAAEGMNVVERLVERHAEAELIGSRVGSPRLELLGCHVERRADELAGARERQLGSVGSRTVGSPMAGDACPHEAPVGRADLAREAEVHDPDRRRRCPPSRSAA